VFFTFLKYPLVLIVAYLVTYTLTPLLARAASALGIIDCAGPRRIHDKPTPRAGGLAIFIGVLSSSLVLFFHPWYQEIRGMFAVPWWSTYLIASTLIVIVGLIDDVKQISPPAKLAGQTVAAVVMYLGHVSVSGLLGYGFPESLDLIATVFWFLVITNAFNLIDGYDGLATGLAAISSLGLAGTMIFRDSALEALFLLGLIGAACAFLRYNMYPAKVFLGDTGSMFLGFTLAAVTLATNSKSTLLTSMGVPILALGIPIIDVILAIWRRSARRILASLMGNKKTGGVMAGDLEHIHHRLANSGIHPRNVAATLYLLNAVLILFGLISMISFNYAQGWFTLALLSMVFIIVHFGIHVELQDSGLIIVYALSKRCHHLVAKSLRIAVDLCGLALMLLAATLLMNPQQPLEVNFSIWLDHLPLWAGLPFCCIYLYELVYQRRKRRIKELKRLRTQPAIVGIVFAMAFSLIPAHTDSLEVLLLATVFAALSLGFLSFSRRISKFLQALIISHAASAGEQ